MNKETIRPIYTELQGYLDQLPKIESNTTVLNEAVGRAIETQVNTTIDELNEITGNDYTRFKISTRSREMNRRPQVILDVQTTRTNLAGIISRLYGQYFTGETSPLETVPTTIIQQSQTQSQSQMLLDFQSLLDSKISKTEDGSTEKGFLETLKSSLTSAKNVNDLFRLVLSTGKDFELTISEILQLFT